MTEPGRTEQTTTSLEEIKKIDLKSLEDKLTPQNRAQVDRYISNCSEEWSAGFVLNAIRTSLGKPISNALYLHELEELEEFRRKGHEFVDVNPTIEFRKERERLYDTDQGPHLRATLLHCRYLQLLAEKAGYNISLGTCLEYDPISSPQNKQDLKQQDPTLTVNEEQKEKAKQFFIDLAKDERNIFDQPLSLGNSRVYSEALFEK